jgi:hypothetical protein
MRTLNSETILKAAAALVGVFIAAFAVFVIFIHPGNIN